MQNEDPHFWLKKQASPSWASWAGYAFEGICLKHISSIKAALKIGGVITQETYWRSSALEKGRDGGVQIDLVIDRSDQCINICEIKFSNKPFLITKRYAEELERKKRVFKEKTEDTKDCFLNAHYTLWSYRKQSLCGLG